jgi:tetraacyldisaccharide 4'-kinase
MDLIKEKTKDLVTAPNRKEAIANAIKRKFNLIILDDGFQDHSIEKNLSILCFNNNQLIGNGLTIPSGPLREPFSSIKNSQIAIINGNTNKKFEEKIKDISNGISIYYCKYLPINIKKLENANLIAFSGIGNPENFFDMLSNYKLNIKKRISFPDHYNYTKNDIKNLLNLAKEKNSRLLTTEKDYFRLKYLGLNENISYLSVQLVISEEEKFFKEIKSYIE